MKLLNSSPLFSFLYGGKACWELPYQSEVTENGNERKTTYLLEDGLKVTNVFKTYGAYGAYEWVNWFENTGTQDTQILSELWDCDCIFSCEEETPHAKNPWRPDLQSSMTVYSPKGSNWDEFEFDSAPVLRDKKYSSLLFANGRSHEYQSSGGRSSQGLAPFFNIHQKNKGVIMAIGWTGQWNCRMSRSCDQLHLQSKIEDTHFLLHPGEKIRTSSVVLLPYEGSFEDSQNLWRRLVREEFSDGIKRGRELPFCSGFWGGLESERIMARIDRLCEAEIPFNFMWIDAGWYGKDTKPTFNEFEGDWATHTGDWTVSPLIHPKGLVDVGEKIKKKGKKFVLWFEPERVRANLSFAQDHADWLLSSQTNPSNLLLNLGNEEAFSYVLELLCERIRTQQVDCYRQDFNFEPLPYWRAADAKDRQGITEIKHIMGLYRLWDSLLARFPHLIIDNCASGGKRIDIETLRRSVPLWRSDAQCPADPYPEVTQCHGMNFSQWMPYSGTGSGRLYDTYSMRSAYAPCLTTNYAYSETEHFGEDPEQVAWLKERAEEYLRIRPYFEGDIYHLTKPNADLGAWCAVQWNRPEQGDGMLQVFVREDSLYTEASLPIKKIDPKKSYRFTDLDGDSFTVSGKELAERGLRLRIEEKRVAKIYVYQSI